MFIVKGLTSVFKSRITRVSCSRNSKRNGNCIFKHGDKIAQEGGEPVGYYQQNNDVLKFKVKENKDEILFNHYITRKENLLRMTGELPRGQFYIAENTAANDLNVSRWKIREMLKRFEEMGIITRIFKPEKGSKNPSIFQYNSAVKDQHDNQYEKQHDAQHEEASNIKDLRVVNQHHKQHEKQHVNQQSKKEDLKKNIYSAVIQHLNEKTGKSYRSGTKATQRYINARLNEGFTQEDLINVIDKKTSEWKGGDYEMYLRPSTLFGEKFEGYLNNLFSQQAKEDPEQYLNFMEGDYDSSLQPRS